MDAGHDESGIGTKDRTAEPASADIADVHRLILSSR
jgi:hypothetical protein